ncbi:hypothetical protein BGX28_008705 [Mortierella sp. GBA30]|nr:hypothetical protein BGX28_008705 [Mortierella sp. GBA30]
MTSSSEMNVQEVLDNLTRNADNIERVQIDQTSLTAAIAQHHAAVAAVAAASPSSSSEQPTPDQQLERIAQQLQQEHEQQHQEQEPQTQDQHVDAATAEEHPVGHVETLLDSGSGSMLATVPITPENSAAAKAEKPLPGSEEWHKLRRDNHKEVERRRRETINAGITDLSKVVPNCDKNKGAVLRQTVKYIQSIQETHERLMTEAAQREANAAVAMQEREKALLEKEVAQGQLQTLMTEHEQLKRDYEALRKEYEEMEESKKRQPRHRNSFDKDYWTFRQEQDEEKEYRAKQQHQFEQHQQEKEHPKFPAEGSKERVPLSTFEVPKDLYLTHDVAIPHSIPPWTKADSEMLDTVVGLTLKTEMLRLEYGKNEDLSDKPQRLDFAELSRAERLYKALWNHVLPIYQSLSGGDLDRERQLRELAKTRSEVDFFLRLEKRLFPWLLYGRGTSFELYKSYKGKGLVFCAGNNQFEFVITAIQAIRNRLKSTLPIQIFHMGDSDLSKERQAYLRDMASDIEIVDVTQILDNDYMRLGGWAIKPFAMLASSFEEVMFVDADAYFLQDPVVLFDDPGYKATGALFFFDRTLFPNWSVGSDWMKSILPIMSSFPPKSRMFNLLTAHEQESGVVLINKKTRFLGMLGTCKMNGKWERDLISYKVFHGDKETFWIGFEMIQEPYAFMRNYGGVIGELRPDNDQSVCGAQLHEDHKGQPLWWNGGLYRNKNAGVTRNLNFGYWMSGGGHQEHRERYTLDKETMIQVLTDLGLSSSDELKLEPRDPEWDFNESCLAGGPVKLLTDREKQLANGYIGIDKIAREDGRKASAGQSIDPKHDWDHAIA